MSKRNRYLVVAGILGLVAGGGAVAFTAHRTPTGAGRPRPCWGPHGDVKWDEADPTCSMEAAKRGG